jgi:hypothetical protein
MHSLRAKSKRANENHTAPFCFGRSQVRFYRNGDRYFSGMIYVVSNEHHRTFESLLADLTQSLVCDHRILPAGVRYLFAVDTGRRLTSIDQIEDGASYVCSSTALYRPIDYTRISLQQPTRIGCCRQVVVSPALAFV